jgi:hypothetical protein
MLDYLGTDSEEDEEGSDVHKLGKIRQAMVNLHQTLTIMLKGQYEWDGKWKEVVYQREVLGGKPPENILQHLQDIYAKIDVVARMVGGTALPITVQGMVVRREELEIDVQKIGNGIRIVYANADQKGLETENFPVKFRAQFSEALSIIFGTQDQKSRLERFRALNGPSMQQ